MPDVDELEIDNWVISIPENCFCTVKSKIGRILVEGVRFSKYCDIDQLDYIKVTPDILSVCGFKHNGAIYIRISNSGIEVSIYHNQRNSPYIINDKGEVISVYFLHKLQNIYFQLTGDRLTPNIYGVHY